MRLLRLSFSPLLGMVVLHEEQTDGQGLCDSLVAVELLAVVRGNGVEEGFEGLQEARYDLGERVGVTVLMNARKHMLVAWSLTVSGASR